MLLMTHTGTRTNILKYEQLKDSNVKDHYFVHEYKYRACPLDGLLVREIRFPLEKRLSSCKLRHVNCKCVMVQAHLAFRWNGR